MTRRTRPAIHIELKHADALRDAELMRAALERAGLVGQPVDARRAAALTGMPLDQAAEALSALSLTRRAQLDSDDAGELVYRFASLARVQAPRVVDRVGERIARLEPVLDVLLTLGLVAVGLVITAGGAYLTAYVASIEALPVLLRLVALLASGALFLATALLFAFPAVPLYLFAQIPAHMAAEDGTPGSMLFGGLLMGAGAGVYGWLIGGQVRRIVRELLTRLYAMGQPASDALADERRFLALARASSGRVRTGDLVRLFGWTVDEARAEVVRLVGDYGGDIEVDDDGVIWFVFERFADGGATPSPPIWERDAWSPRRYDDSGAGAGVEAMWLQIGAALGLVALALIAWIEPSFYKLDSTFDVPRWVVDGAWWGMGAALVMVLALLAPRALIVASRQRAWEARRPWQLFLEQLLSSPEWPHGAWVAAQTPNAWLLELGAEIDAERGDGDKLWVNLPEL